MTEKIMWQMDRLSKKTLWLGAVSAACFFALGSGQALSAPAKAEPASQRQVLPDEVTPSRYDIHITPDAAKMRFDGKVTIAISVKRPTQNLTLNAADLTFSKVVLSGHEAETPKVTFDAEVQTAKIGFAAPIQPGDYSLTIDYAGQINTQSRGLFAVDYEDANGKGQMLVTQFEAPDARRFVPSWDEPSRKAVFALEAIVPEGRMALSNMPEMASQSLGGGLKKVQFAPSPKMSSYLLFFGVGDLERRTIKVGTVDVGVVTKRGDLDQGQIALEDAAKILVQYNDYFGTPYPLPKLDNLAVPNGGGFGAMENWGAILYFDRVLLLDPSRSNEVDRQNVYSTVAHEVAHQWFGDLVTMAWWDDIWLNEGFASWMEARVADKMHPDWKVWLKEESGKEYAMSLDAKASTHPVVQTVNTVEQVSQAFDAITYQKGQAVIRMVEDYAGDGAFREAVRAYMRTHAYGNTVTQDLWSAVETAAQKPIMAIADDFVRQPGVPLITLESAVCSKGQTAITLRQGRFGLDEASKVSGAWRVPVRVSVLGQAGTQTVLTSGKPVTKAVIAGCGPIKLNAGQAGYFRSNYAPVLKAGLITRFNDLEASDQLGLLNDGFALTQGGYAPIGDYLDLSSRLGAASDPTVMDRAQAVLGRLSDLFEGDPRQGAMGAYGRSVLNPVLAKIGWRPASGESPRVGLLRLSLISALGRFDDPAVVAEAKRRFLAADKDPQAMPGDIRSALQSVALSHADQPLFDEALRRARSTKSQMERNELFAAMAGVRDPALAKQVLDLAISDRVSVTIGPRLIQRLSDRHEVMAWQFSLDHLDRIGKGLDSMASAQFMPSLLSGTQDPAMVQTLADYIDKSVRPEDRARANAALGSARQNVRFKSEQRDRVDSWLRKKGF
jgi:aminopeptidase N